MKDPGRIRLEPVVGVLPGLSQVSFEKALSLYGASCVHDGRAGMAEIRTRMAAYMQTYGIMPCVSIYQESCY